MQAFSLSDCTIRMSETFPTVDLWRVRGIDHTFFPTNICAEVAARQVFPQEDERTRYGRIHYQRFINEEDFL